MIRNIAYPYCHRPTKSSSEDPRRTREEGHRKNIVYWATVDFSACRSRAFNGTIRYYMQVPMFLLSLVCLPRSHDVRPSASEGFLCHFLFPRETANFLSVCKPQMSRKKSFQEKVSHNDHETWNLGAFFFEDYPDAGRTLWARINHDNYYQICILHEMELAISEHLGAIIIESKCGRERLSPALGDYQNWGDKLFLRIIFLQIAMWLCFIRVFVAGNFGLIL